jgi:hypothetical protein
MIYGEEQKQIDISQGLWLDSDLDCVPEGYCPNLVNLVKNPEGSYELRPNFVGVSDFWSTVAYTLSDAFMINATFPTALAGYTGYTSYNHSAFDLQPVNSYAPILAVFEFEAGAAGAYWMCRDGQVTNMTGYGGTGVPQAFAQYRDRYYTIEKTNTYGNVVCRYDFTAGYALTRTALATISGASPGGLCDLVAFRDRLFALQYNSTRIYYTDLATTGGYPESWNSGNNFFDLPDSGANVIRAFIANDRMYIFTTKGVYQLYASGSPSGWQVTPITSDIRIQSYDQVNYVNGVFYYTDKNTVFVYNGSNSIEDIGKPLRGLFRSRFRDYALPVEGAIQVYDGPSAFKFHPYMEGVLMAAYFYTASGGRLEYSRIPKYYYHDGGVWTEVQFDTDLGGSNRGHYDLLLVGRNKSFKTATAESYKLNDVLIELRYNSNTTQVVFKAKTIRRDNQDIDLYNFETKFGIYTKDQEYAFPNVTRFKECRVDVNTSISGLMIIPYIDGTATDTYSPTFSAIGSHKLRTPVGNQRGNSIAISIAGTLNKTTGPSGDQSTYIWPSFRLNRIMPVVNTDTRKLPDQDYAS